MAAPKSFFIAGRCRGEFYAMMHVKYLHNYHKLRKTKKENNLSVDRRGGGGDSQCL